VIVATGEPPPLVCCSVPAREKHGEAATSRPDRQHPIRCARAREVLQNCRESIEAPGQLGEAIS